MIETDGDGFRAANAGRYTIVGSAVIWCASPTLGGAVLWGEPSETDTREILRIFDRYPQLMGRFDMVLDTRGVVRVDPAGLALLFSWLVANRVRLAAQMRLQANVIAPGPIGFLLTGLLPVAQWVIPYRIDHDPLPAFRAVAGDEGARLCEEVDAIVERVRGVPRELRVSRAMLNENLDVTLGDIARALRLSGRSLQRVLHRHGTSFHAELVAARFRRAQTLLTTSDDKVTTIASRVGISERALRLLFQQKTGRGPAEWRKLREP